MAENFCWLGLLVLGKQLWHLEYHKSLGARFSLLSSGTGAKNTGATTTMVEPKQLIPHITDASKSWVVRVTVVESISTMICSNGSKLKRYILTDIEGNEVLASIYGDEVDLLCPMITSFGVYDISNADVKSIEKKYRILPNPFQWIIRRQTLIRRIPEASTTLTFFLDSLTPFSKITEMTNSGNTNVDIMGIIIDVDEVKSVKHSRNTVQHFTIINLEKIPLRFSLWDEMIQNEGHTLLDAAAKHSVIVAKRLAIKTFNSISLASKNSTSFTVDPPLKPVQDMKSWFSNLSATELEEMRKKEATTYTKELVTSGKMQTYTLSKILKTAPAGDYWVRGYLHLVDDYQKLYYVACGNCLSKINTTVGVQYTCIMCRKNVIATLRLLLILIVADETEKVEVIAVSEVAEQILQTTVEDMLKFYNTNHKLDLEPIKARLHGKPFLMLLRRTTGTHSDTQRRLMLISYSEDSTPAVRSLPSSSVPKSPVTDPKTNSPTFENKETLSLSPLKRQMNEVAISSGTTSKRQLRMSAEEEKQDIPDPASHRKQE